MDINQRYKKMNELNLEKPRWNQLTKAIPDVLQYKSILYVGGHMRFGRNLQLLPYFEKAGYEIDIVEIFYDNCVQMTNAIQEQGRNIRVIWADIKGYVPDREYDIVLWHHGCEHIRKDELPNVLSSMLQYTKHLIILGTPNGNYEQGAEYGNQYEIHQSHWSEEDFQDLELHTSAIGVPGTQNGNIFAWWRRGEE